MDTRSKLKYKSLESLKPHCDLKLDKHSVNLVMKKCMNCNYLQKAKEYEKLGEFEDAYILIMKLCCMFTYIQGSKEYKNDLRYYKNMIGSQFVEAVKMAESLTNILEELYDMNNNVKSEENNIKVEETKPVAIPLDINIKTVELFNMMIRSQTEPDLKILIIDTRTEEDFEKTCLILKDRELVNMINVPHHIIKPGLSALKVQAVLPNSSLQHWEKRGSYSKIVILDFNSTQSNEKPAHVLKNIFDKYDLVKYQGDIHILEGGFEEFTEDYPWHQTNQQVRTKVTHEVTIPDLSTVNFDHIDFNVNHDALKPYFNRSTKPVLMKKDGEMPFIDRSSKTAAVQTYAERSELLRQKEQETKKALEMQKELLKYETALQENLRLVKELQYDEERVASLRETMSELIMTIEKLKNESASKDKKIEELQKHIEERPSEALKESSSEEREIGNRIRNQEQETKFIKQKCDALEKQQDCGEMRKEAALKYKKETTKLIQDVTNLQVKNRPVTPPPFNRASKPKPPEPIIGNSPGLTGLKNLGNTCYMNSILQCISNSSVLADFFLKSFHPNHRTRVAEKVAEVVRCLWSGQYRSVGCDEFKNTVGSIKSEYKTHEQQDSHEFLTFLMDWLHNDLKESPPIVIEDVKNEMEKAWLSFKAKNESLISNLFYGLQMSTVSCLNCHERSSTYEPFSNLSLIIPENDREVTLEECLKLYLKEEVISGWRCPKCKDERKAKKRTELCKLPSILVIHLKRFSFFDVSSRKRTTFVNFPLESWTLHGNKDDCLQYNLYGVSNHYGTMEGGHYTAFCKNGMFNRWYKFDDHHVAEITEKDVKTDAAYILFYNSTHIQNRPS